MKTAKDLMTKHPVSFQSGETLRDAIDRFVELDIHCCPVVTPMGDVIGLMTEMGLVKAALKYYYSEGTHEKLVHHGELLEKPVFVGPDASLDEVTKAIISGASHRVLVKNMQDRLIGIISPKDILRVVTGDQQKGENLRQEVLRLRTEADGLHAELESLKTSLEKYQQLFHDTPNMMHGSDQNGKIVFANAKIHQILGYAEDELLSKTIFDIYPKSLHHEVLKGLSDLMNTGGSYAIYTTMVKKNGNKIRVEISSSALRDKNNRFLSTISISREIDSEALLRALHGQLESVKS